MDLEENTIRRNKLNPWVVMLMSCLFSAILIRFIYSFLAYGSFGLSENGVVKHNGQEEGAVMLTGCAFVLLFFPVIIASAIFCAERAIKSANEWAQMFGRLLAGSIFTIIGVILFLACLILCFAIENLIHPLKRPELQPAKETFIITHIQPPASDLTGRWDGSWQDPMRHNNEEFRFTLSITGNDVSGQAVFMDANGTKADITGQVSGTKVRLLMSPHPTAPFHAISETTWIGISSNGTISGTWHLHARKDYAYATTGPWSATHHKGDPKSPAE